MHAKKIAGPARFIRAFSFVARELGASNRSLAVVAGLAILFGTAATAQNPAPRVLNVPYRCSNGITYTVTICKPFGADQW
jgi:hypothetical protein